MDKGDIIVPLFVRMEALAAKLGIQREFKQTAVGRWFGQEDHFAARASGKPPGDQAGRKGSTNKQASQSTGHIDRPLRG